MYAIIILVSQKSMFDEVFLPRNEVPLDTLRGQSMGAAESLILSPGLFITLVIVNDFDVAVIGHSPTVGMVDNWSILNLAMTMCRR